MSRFVGRYGPGAGLYDVVSGERPIYRAGRVAAIEALQLRPGDAVLDVGCGTGLSLPLLRDAVGPGGRIVGLDASAEMLGHARRRVAGAGWSNVSLLQADAGRLAEHVEEPVNGVLLAYSLSIVDDWRCCWRQALGKLVAGGRVAVVDTAPPTGYWKLLSPPAWLAIIAGGVDPGRQVWNLVDGDTIDVEHHELKGGHVRLGAGTSPGVAR